MLYILMMEKEYESREKNYCLLFMPIISPFPCNDPKG